MKTLKQLRQEKFKKQADFARALEVSKSTICEWESGKREPNVQQILRIAEVLNISRYTVLDIIAANKNDQQ